MTDHPDAPTAGEESLTSCLPDDTRWPCSHITALNNKFVTADSAPVCDPDQPDHPGQRAPEEAQEGRAEGEEEAPQELLCG